MSVQTGNKLNRLEQTLPEGLLVDAAWLERHGYSRSLRSQYVSAGWLQQPTRSVFRRPRGAISWEQVVISLQTLLGYSITVGGRTALELQGFAHYVPRRLKKASIFMRTTNCPHGWSNCLLSSNSFFIIANGYCRRPRQYPHRFLWIRQAQKARF
jgi:hypothetical protein